MNHMSTEKYDPRKNLKPFPKGQSGNPGGKPKKDLAIKAFRETTYDQFIANLQKYGSLSREQMAEELRRPDATMFELMFGNIVASAAKGDDRARQLLIDRLWGKVKENIDFNVRLKTMSDQELLDLGKQAIKVLEGEAKVLPEKKDE